MILQEHRSCAEYERRLFPDRALLRGRCVGWLSKGDGPACCQVQPSIRTPQIVRSLRQALDRLPCGGVADRQERNIQRYCCNLQNISQVFRQNINFYAVSISICFVLASRLNNTTKIPDFTTRWICCTVSSRPRLRRFRQRFDDINVSSRSPKCYTYCSVLLK